MKRWNGLPGTVVVAKVEGRAVEAGTPVLWAVKPGVTVVAEVPSASADGSVLFCQLDLQSHVSAASRTYDPVAERILLNLLSW